MKRIIIMAGAVIALAGMTAQADITYVDAVVDGNTVASSGNPSSGWFNPSATFATSDLWGQRSFGNGPSILQAHTSTLTGDVFEELQTTISGLTPGQQYEIFTFFWDADGNQAWNIDTGLTSGSLTSYSGADNAAIPDTSDGLASTLTFDGAVMTVEDNRVLLYANLGLATADGSGEIDVFVDNSLSVGGNAQRTWFDGVGYQIPEPTTISLMGLFAGFMFFARTKLKI